MRHMGDVLLAGTLKPVGSLDFYLDAIKEAVDEAKARYPQRKVHLVVSECPVTG